MTGLTRFGTMRPPRGGLLSVALGVLALTGCQEQRVAIGTQLDVTPPVVSIAKTAGDTMDVSKGLKFDVNVTDNLGIKTVSVALSGGYTQRVDSTFRTAITALTIGVNIGFPANTTAGGFVQIRVTATDGNNNSTVATDSILLTNINALIVTLVRPVPGAQTSAGKGILVQVSANQNNGVKKVGWTSTGAVVSSDSVLVAPIVPPSVFPDTVTFIDTLIVPGTVTGTTFNVAGFAEDSSGRRVVTPAVAVTVVSVATDTTPPSVTFSVAKRVEVRDSITVRAIDPSGIGPIGWTATDLATGLVVGGATVNKGGTLTDIIEVFNLNLATTVFPQTLVVRAFATDAAGNTGQSRRDTSLTSPLKSDTITVVNGITRPLPAGGRVADAIYNKNLNEIYLTNVELNRLEIFSVTDTSFKAAIPVGSKPWGIGLWPRDTLGNNADSVVVANSGGTNLSIVDVSLAVRRERRRHALPNFLVQSVQTELDQTLCPAGGPILPACIKIKFTTFDFSDRPEYVGTTCRPVTGSTNCASDSIYAVYSTTPTIDQGQGFTERGTMRWEQVGTGALQSHFFWEQAEVVPSPQADTLQIIVDRGPLVAPDTVLGAMCGRMVDMDQLAFFDTTFVRNSGNFTHAFIGEGGNTGARFARVLNYNGTLGISQTVCAPGAVAGFPLSGREEWDLGLTPGGRVRDFIANTATSVKSIATNFNGKTNMLRADSIYVLNESLRLMGIIQVTGTNVGTDLNFDHRFDANSAGTVVFPPGTEPNANNRLVFTARADANVDVFDTYFYGKVATVSLRDPVIGTLRVAKDPVSGAQVLIGVTARGIVVARLAAITNTFQAKIWGAPID